MARKGVNPRVVISRASDMKKLAIALAIAWVMVALTIWGLTQRAGYQGDKTSQREVSVDFDFYLLALTLHPAFCADHGRKPECRAGRSVPISIHGLWPENLAPGRYPRDCAGPALDLAPALERDLSTLMPGMADGLHEHEWRRHGTCSGLDDDEYFRHTVTLARRIDAALRPNLTTLAGGTTGAAALRDHADRASPGLGATLTFHGRTLREAPPGKRGEPFLVEIRQCVDDDGEGGAPLTPLDCATVQRRDQGCGREFHVAGTAVP
jgi:ribonuclease I